MIRWLFLLILTAACAAAGAQPLGTDLLVSQSNGALLRFPQSGAPRTITTYPSPMGRITMDIDNQSLVALDLSNRVVRIDAVSGAVVRVVWAGLPLQFAPTALAVDRNGDYLVVDSNVMTKPYYCVLYRVRRDGSAVSTVMTLPGGYVTALTTDPTTGDWIVADSPPNAFPTLFHLDPISLQPTPRTAVPLLTLFGVVADPHRAAIYLTGGPTDSILRYDPARRRILTTMASGFDITAAAIDRAGGARGELIHAGTATGSIARFDRTGRLVSATPTTGARINGVVIDQSRNPATAVTAAPNDYAIGLRFPAGAGRAFVLACGLSGFAPGVTLPDGRIIPLNPDPLTLAAVRGAIPHLLSGNLGVLNSGGRATAALRLNPFGKALAGVRLWLVAITLDPQAPAGVGEISAPLILRL